MNKFIRFGIGFLFTLILTSFICLYLYYNNNKYTSSSTQPIMGQLVLSEKELDEVLYLIQDWEFYPDVLLTPQDLQTATASPYMVYTSIGDYTRFDSLGRSHIPHGQGSYALRLWLPEEKHSYSLELPEIFSAYTLYLNGVNVLTMGDPSPAAYEARTKVNTITFEAGGALDILIAVSDYSHFYSGLVYPPAFGVPDSIQLMQNIRSIFTMIPLTLGLLFFLFSLCVAISLKKSRALLFALLCLSMSGATFFPLLHTLKELSVSPWYALELICIYSMTLLVLLLHNYICQAPVYLKRAITAIAAFILVLAAGYGFFSAHLTVEWMQRFSWLIFVYKLLVAAYLLLTAALALKRETMQAHPLFYSCISYAVFFLWDRILPSYEPIFLGWFQDWGNMIMILGIGYILGRDLIQAQINQLTFEENYRQMDKQLTLQKEYTNQLNARGEENRKLIHDFKHHLRTISQLAGQVESCPKTVVLQEKLLDYLEQVVPQPSSLSPVVYGSFSENSAIDALFQYYDLRSKEEGISTDFRLLLPPSLPLPEVQLCTLLGNLLENAMEACCRLPAGQKRFIRLSCQIRGQVWFFCLENSYDGIVQIEKGRFVTRKENSLSHGIGLKSIKDMVWRHKGSLDIYPLKEVFRVGITLPF